MVNEIKRFELSDGVIGNFIPTTRFKTARLSVSFYVPMREDTASAYALLPFILTGCGKEYPTSRIISRHLDNLYNAALACECTKMGDLQVLSVSITCMENKYALDGSDIILKCANMLSSLIFNPLCDEGGFEEQNFEKEKRLMLERIDSEINNKRSYALSRCVAEVCKGEPCSIPRYGSRQGQVELTRGELYAAWETLLRTAYVRIG
ncbi:MAG: insulinase family protein, partial [Acutalibacteraceae bacterium]|nr:insulinase family protein [Acutalibacteraceae bacterium]